MGEAFTMIDQNRDSIIDKEDLVEIFNNLGKNHPDEFIEDMLKEAPGPINFTMFLTLFGEKLNGTDPEEVIKNAFQCFDDDGAKKIDGEYLKRLLMTMGDRFTEAECEEMFNEMPCEDDGTFDYIEFTRLIKHGPKEEGE